MLVLCVLGMVVAVIRWKVHPGASLLVLIALGMELILSIVFMLLFFGLGTFAVSYAIPSSAWMYTGLYFLQDIFFAIVIILLVKAALTDRQVATT